jgi:hypothetical protein
MLGGDLRTTKRRAGDGVVRRNSPCPPVHSARSDHERKKEARKGYRSGRVEMQPSVTNHGLPAL